MMENGFSTFRLGDVCSKIGSGATPRGGKDVYLESGISLIRSQNIYNNHFDYSGLAFISDYHAGELSTVIVEKEDVLLNITGDSVARVFIVPENILPARVNQHVAIIRPDPKVLNPRFLHYFLTSQYMQTYMLNLSASGGTRKALTKGMIEEFEVPALDIQTQRAIAHILGTLDDKIELNRRMNHTLEAMAREVFKSWFVDFDPVRAKLDSRDTGLPPEIAELFPDGFEDSELGRVPRGWGVGTLDQGFDVTMGQSPPGSTYNEDGDGLPFYQGRRDFGFRYPDQRVFCNAPKRLAQKGDSLVSVRAPVGDLNMAFEESCVGRGVAAVRHKTLSRSFTYYSMFELQYQFARFEAEGTVFGSINKAEFNGLNVVLPPQENVLAFEEKVASLDELIENNFLQIQTLAELRDTLLPKLMRGEVRVGEI